MRAICSAGWMGSINDSGSNYFTLVMKLSLSPFLLPLRSPSGVSPSLPPGAEFPEMPLPLNCPPHAPKVRMLHLSPVSLSKSILFFIPVLSSLLVVSLVTDLS